MESEEIAQHVSSKFEDENPARIRDILVAFLQTLGERLPQSEQEDFAAQLPKDLAGEMLKDVSTDRFELEEFYNRFGARADLKLEDAMNYANEIGLILSNVVSGGEIQSVLEQLPGDYRDLFV